MLCGRCSYIFSDDALDRWLAKTTLDGRNLVVSGANWFHHHLTAAAVCAAASSGCYMCFHVLRLYPSLSTGTMYKVTVFPSKQSFKWAEILPSSLVDVFRGARGSGTTFLLGNVDEADPALILCRLSLSEANTGERHCLSLAKYWLDRCRHHHKRCCANWSPLRYPTRLLALDGAYIRLIVSSSHQPNGPYATLSHCWGDQPIDVLTPKNIGALLAGRLIQELPPSFKDFCKVCQFWVSHMSGLILSVSCKDHPWRA